MRQVARWFRRRGAPLSPQTPALAERSGFAEPFRLTGHGGELPPELSDSRSTPEISRAALAKLRMVSRGLARNSPMLSAYVRRVLNNVLGPKFPVPVLSSDLPLETREAALRAWRSYLDAGVGTGGLSGREVIRQALKQTIIDGDVFILPFVSRNGRTSYTFYASDAIDATREGYSRDGNTFVQGGVVIDRRAGFIRGYYFRDRDMGSREDSRFVSASRVIHVMRPESFNSYRGLPWAAAVLDSLRALLEYQQAEKAKLIAGAKVFLMLKNAPHTVVDGAAKNDMSGFANRNEGGAEVHRMPDIHLNNGGITGLAPGVELAQLQVGQQGLGSEAFRSAMADEIAAGLGVMPSSLTGRFDRVNFSASRNAREIEQRNFADIQAWLVPRLLRPIFLRVMEDAIADGRLSVDARTFARILRSEWRFSPWASTEPHRDLPPALEALGAGVMTRAQVAEISGNSTDFARIVEERAREDELLRDAGLGYLIIPSGGTAPPEPGENEGAPDADEDEADDEADAARDED